MRDTIAVLALLTLSAGCGWHYPPLALIVPGSLVLAGLVASHLLGFTAPPPKEEEK